MNNDIYIITTVTSNRMFAGTKADVFIELIGTKNKTGYYLKITNYLTLRF